jgi:hypothetical protein
MERTIKFRGKSLSTGEWVYGYYYAVPMTFNGSTEVSHAIVDSTGFIYTVDPKTVGQYIGIKDTNGTEIYSGMYCTSELGNGIVTMSCNGQWCLRDGSIHLAFWKLIDYKWKFEVIESENPDLLTQ